MGGGYFAAGLLVAIPAALGFVRTLRRKRREDISGPDITELPVVVRGAAEVDQRSSQSLRRQSACSPISCIRSVDDVNPQGASMSRVLERAVKRAQKRLAQDYGSRDALASLHEARRRLAAARRQAWAEPLDLGVSWDSGAPLPHVVSSGSKAVLVCHAAVEDPDWDGTYVTLVSPNDQIPAEMLEFTFAGCHAVKIGGPNDEALHGHPLYNRGLDGYRPHLIHNSDWIKEQEAINSVHPYHTGGWSERLNHYFFVFHDEMFEALAKSVSARSVRATLTECLRRSAAAVDGE